MSELKVLSKEEVDALIKVTQDNTVDLAQMAHDGHENTQSWTEANCAVNSRALTNVTELTTAEVEKLLSSFLRKKINIKSKLNNLAKLSECLEGKQEKHIYTVFKIMPQDCYGMVIIDLPLLHQSINLLYGGQVNTTETVIETPGKVGIMIAEKICQIGIDGFTKACGEFGKISCDIIKTITLPNLTSKLSAEDRVYSMEMTAMIGELETTFVVIVREDFLRQFIPVKTSEAGHLDSNFWRTAIENQVVDSIVTVNVTLPDISMKMNDLSKLKNGDLIPISDPTLVYVCLNNLKLFRANAGQANSKRVAKILSEV